MIVSDFQHNNPQVTRPNCSEGVRAAGNINLQNTVISASLQHGTSEKRV
jgi:hypothetical protein